MKKTFLRTLSLLCLVGSAIGLGSCGGSESTGSGNPTANNPTAGATTEQTQSLIKSLTAKNAEVSMRIGEDSKAEVFYELKGNGSLNSNAKKVDVTSSDEKVVKVKGTSTAKKLSAVGLGEATITVTSVSDSTKSCTFKITVKDIFFSRAYSNFVGTDDTSKELISEGGIVEVAPGGTGYSQANYVVNGIDSTVWMTEVTIGIKNIRSDEKFPKFGIMTTTTDKAAEGTSNQIHFFLDGYIGDNNNYKWTNFGVCEVFNGGSWAWNDGVNNSQARHKDNAYVLSDGKFITSESFKTDNADLATAETSFKMKVARNGYQFHVWVNDNYAFSMEALHYLLSGADGQPCASMPGFFEFNSNVVFSNYSATSVESEVLAAINGIEGGAKIIAESEYAAD